MSFMTDDELARHLLKISSSVRILKKRPLLQVIHCREALIQLSWLMNKRRGFPDGEKQIEVMSDIYGELLFIFERVTNGLFASNEDLQLLDEEQFIAAAMTLVAELARQIQQGTPIEWLEAAL